MKGFRKAVFWCHLVTGVFVGLVVLIMSVTGVLLTYEKQMLAWADARAVTVPAPAAGAQRLPVDELMRRVRAAEPGKATAVTWRAGESTPVRVAFGRERAVYVDPYTGGVLGEGAAGMRAFFRGVTDWHRWLAAKDDDRAIGKAITGACNLGFLFLVVSGFYLWWPRNWSPRALRNVTWFRGGLRARARDFNWHNVIGFWSAVPLFVVVASAVVISYPWASNLVYRAVGESPPPPQGQGGGAGGARPGGGPAGGRQAGGAPGGERGRGEGEGGAVSLAGIDPLLARAQARVPGWRTITLTLPADAGAPVSFNIDRGSGGQPQKRATLAFDRASGAETKWEPFAAGTPGRRLRSILRFAHTGEVLGLAGQTIAGIVSLGAAVLVWTGLWLSFRRLRAWRDRRGRFPGGRRVRRTKAEPVAAD